MFISLIFFIYAYNSIIPFAEKLFISKSTNLKDFQLRLIPEDFKLEDVLTEDVMFPAWNFETEVPYLFSKVGRMKNPNSEYQVNVGDMVFASQSNPVFFGDGRIDWVDEDGKKRTSNFFGGNTVAISPAMYAVFQSIEHRKIPQEKLNMISVGNIAQNS